MIFKFRKLSEKFSQKPACNPPGKPAADPLSNSASFDGADVS